MMKIISCKLVVICVLSLCFTPAEAQELLMSEEEMGAISISERLPLALDMQNLLVTYKDREVAPRASVINDVVYDGSYSWCDEDGCGPGTGRGCISVSYDYRGAPTPENSSGTIRAENIVTVTGGKPVNALRLQLDDRVVSCAYFGIDSIQLGPAGHEGPILRSFYISDFSLRITGTVDISMRK
jgi:hypothetical protein